MRVVNTAENMLEAFEEGRFHMKKWEAYIDASASGIREKCVNDMKECVSAGFSWEKEYLPVLNAVLRNGEKRREAIESFRAITRCLNDKVLERFGRTVDVDVVLYLGLCNGAGWVTDVNGRRSILLGIEKIIELDWCGRDAMTGLIVHELGHAYHLQYGAANERLEALPDPFLWRLFEEGIAMVFEQEVVGDSEYFHQEADGWKAWCDANAEKIKRSFYGDLPGMTRENQRYFGDWVRFEGRGDAGYYLGARFVRFLLDSDVFDTVIRYKFDEVKRGFERFMQ